jgi:hypothetical protein
MPRENVKLLELLGRSSMLANTGSRSYGCRSESDAPKREARAILSYGLTGA